MKGKLSKLLLAMTAVVFASALAVPAMAWAEEDPWYDASATTLTIENKDDLLAFAAAANVDGGNNFSGKLVELTTSIDLGGDTWTPISSFAGEFDGNGNTISNFCIDATSSSAGFFGTIAAGSGERVHDLVLADVTATVGNYRFGTLANSVQGIVNRVTVENVTVTTKHTGAWVGGMCAFMSWPWMNDCAVKNLTVNAEEGADLIGGFACILQKNSNMVFDNLDVEGLKVTVADADSSGCGVAGFVAQTQRGWEYPKVTNCDVSGIDVTASGLVDVGGFIAWPGAHTTAENCTTQGKIDVAGVTSGDCFAGGFFGNLGWNCDLGQMGHFLTNCTADVDIVTKLAPAGGFVGSATNSNDNSMYATFTNCAASGDVTCVEGGTADIGGFAGDADRGTYLDCSAAGSVVNNGTGNAGKFVGAIYDVTPKYDGRYPAYTRDYPVDVTTLSDCSYDGGPSDLQFVGNTADGADVSEEFRFVARFGTKHFETLQKAIDAASATPGNHTVTLLAGVGEDVTVKQAEGVNVTIDGAGNEFSGTIYIHGNARHNGEETLVIKNVKFVASGAEAHDFISSNETGSAERYAHNVTVEGCDFDASGATGDVVAMRMRQSFDIVVKNCTAVGLHSFMWATGGTGIEIDGLTASNCRNGLSFGTADNVAVRNSVIEAMDQGGYGIRVDGSGAYSLTIETSAITAARPVIARNTTGDYSLTIDGESALASTAENGYQVILTNGKDDAAFAVPTGAYVLSVAESVKAYPDSDYVAKVGDTGYMTLSEALAAARAGDTVTVLKDAVIEVGSYEESFAVSGGATLSITGGEFAVNPEEFVSYPYYTWEDNGVWKISRHVYVPPALPETGCDVDAACNAFNDVDADAWYHEVVDWAVANDILRGYDDGSGNLGPEDATLRTHVAVMMWRMAGEPAPTADPGYKDVKAGAWYYDAVAWAKECGLLIGYQDGSNLFGTSDVMTREQMAVTLHRFAQMLGVDVSVGEDTNILSYVDALEISEYAVPAMQWAVGAGIIGGYTDADGEPTGYLGPKDDAERAHFAAMLMRMDEAYGIL